MVLISLEGLPFSGKSTTCDELYDYYISKGLAVVKRSKGHLTGRIDKWMKLSFEALEKWDYALSKPIQDFVNLGFLSMYYDLGIFLNETHLYEEIDIMIVDRLYIGHYVTSEYFGIDYKQLRMPPSINYEFILSCTYKEACRRSLIRNNMHGKLTQYIMNDEHIYNSLQLLYNEHSRNHQSVILDNEQFKATSSIIKILSSEGLA